MKKWKLWLDDQAHNIKADKSCHAPNGFIAAASSGQAIQLIKDYGVPEFINFDYDMGPKDSAYTLIRHLITNYTYEPPSDWEVHACPWYRRVWNFFARPNNDIDIFMNNWNEMVKRYKKSSS